MTENQYPIDESAMQEQADWMAGRGGSWISRLGRHLSETTSRRSMLGTLGRVGIGAAGVAVIGALPVSRALGATNAEPASAGPAGHPAALPDDELFPAFDQTGDSSTCEYWRWCNMDGTPCTSCAGGGMTTCSPGSKPGAEFWVGCCTNPDDDKTYLIAYYDCCGASGCSNTFCGQPDNQAIMYNPVSGSFDQEIIWCVSDESQSYTCTMAPIIGTDCQVRPAARPKVGAGS
ncbi:methylamine dehydrogenase light chain [Microbacterium sp. M]|uniref:methylamine dehydrogenase light chain n=1 Tax=Microbacterium sp. M TaxID=3377125 RepID=UPI00386F86A8